MGKKEVAVIGLLGTIAAVAAVAIARARKPPGPGVVFSGFRSELHGAKTTTRQRDGAEAYDFWHFPLVDITADVDGDFTVLWSYTNTLDGTPEYASSEITNVFTLEGGKTTQVELRDLVGDPRRGESIAYGDPDELFDGVWHAFKSTVSVHVTSPSGATATCTGVLTETFKTVGALAASFADFRVQQVATAGATVMLARACPVCGTQLPKAPLGQDVPCPACGFVSAWTG